MHYLGNLGVTNYKLKYSDRFLAASVLIAIGDCLAVLALFYHLREKWISSWWKRVGCALTLAGGISAMHFTASCRCEYEFRRSNTPSEIRNRDNQIIISGVCCGTAALMVLAVLVLARARTRLLKSRSQKIMLACAMFAPDNKVLVTTEGVLPSQEITDKYLHRTFDEEFDISHPVYQWIFRLTHNWVAVSDLIPYMRSHLAAEQASLQTEPNSEPKVASSRSSALYDAHTYSNYELIFRERFCTAASWLAQSMDIPLEHLGVLYDKVIETGTLPVDKKSRARTFFDQRTMAGVEAALRTSIFGKGQVLFIARELIPGETERLLNSGFRLAGTQHVSRTIAHAMQIPQVTLEAHLRDLRRYAQNMTNTEQSGTYLAFFAMMPKPNHKGFDVAVQKNNQDRLPDVPLPTSGPSQWQAAFLDSMDGYRVPQCIAFCDDCEERPGEHGSLDETQFAAAFKQAMETLTEQLPRDWKNEAKFWAKPLVVPPRCLASRSTASTLYAFTCIGDMHTSINKSEFITRIPRTFFDARHRCYPGSPDHAVLKMDIYAAFSPLLVCKQSRRDRYRRQGRRAMELSAGPMKKHMRTRDLSVASPSRGSSSADQSERPSLHELSDRSFGSSVSTSNRNQVRSPDMGLLSPSDIVVDMNGKNDESSPEEKDNEAAQPGTRSATTTALPEKTFVDELSAITKSRFLPASTKCHARDVGCL